MAIEYLKKKKMHSIMCDIFGIAPKMIDTYYNFYRGSEWLQCSYGGCCYEIYASNGGAYLTSESKEYDWDADRYVNVNRKVYNGYGKYTYPIHEKCLAEEQETLKAEDLPFPEVMEQENKPWEMMDAEERADEFFNFPEEPELPFPKPEVKNELLSPDDAREYVEYKYNCCLSDCSKPYGCDEEHLNYLHGYFTMAGELGAVTMHRAEDMVHELTHVFDKVNNVFGNEYGCMDMEELFIKAFELYPIGTCTYGETSISRIFKCVMCSKIYILELEPHGRLEANVYAKGKKTELGEVLYYRVCADAKVLMEAGDE